MKYAQNHVMLRWHHAAQSVSLPFCLCFDNRLMHQRTPVLATFSRVPEHLRGNNGAQTRLAQFGAIRRDVTRLSSLLGAFARRSRVPVCHNRNRAKILAEMNAFCHLAHHDGVAVLTIDSPPVNALSQAVRAGVAAQLAEAVADPAVQAIVLICAGRTFIAGADITEFDKPPAAPSFHDVIGALEGSPKPVVAAIHGTALGGGLETALACHFRVAVPSARLGLPEVKLGLLPGAGGTQRLPRAVGAALALEMVTSGTAIGAALALEKGLVDALAPEGELQNFSIGYARQAAADGWELKKLRDRTVQAEPGLFATFRTANAKKFRGFDAPEFNIRCIEAAVEKPFDEGEQLERALFTELMNGTQSKAQRHLFFAEREAQKIPGLPKDVAIRPIQKIGIIGAGTMGGGIGMNFLSAGFPVTMVEASDTALQRGVGVMRANYEATAKKGRLSHEAVERNMARLKPSMAMEDLADCDLVIEAVFENMEVKREIFATLDGIVKAGAILATNTSYLDIDRMAAMTRRPQDVCGMHFFSPANVMRLLEVVRADKTAPDVLATVMRLARKIGKVAVVAGVCHGFIGNRMLALRQREANKLILEGAMPWDVDRVITGFGFPMGPFQMADLAGLDIGWSAGTSKGETLRDQLCERDRRGQKTRSGFYDYSERREASPSALVEELVLQTSAAQGFTRRSISDEEILERCLYTMINEAALILEEGKAYRASDIDMVWVTGYGFPAYRGGPMFYADTVGLGHIVERLRFYQAMSEADFKPAPLLEKLAAEGGQFSRS
jgi:3-hydroxyacyl-CoA dehydrogenase